ncbi:uncharacterized protein LOC110451583 isoform X2 [Mizuhopecten yessoensis]|uniref:Uncharacterized protein n=1 Tax=Mizuhopecten yessoensis TaxID=6573 RepID=A0A210R500_MIZYE|nr:uncharacterized protein LOC110451583 isoform X2 [Mizuhopecten yessoensis]OWF56100.1 hypothetical protein KP79_PYT03657 [Mizuhopecten yessoensis]
MGRLVEKLISRMRRKNVVILRWEDRYDNSNSHSTMRIRHNLQRLMGTDVIRLNDRNYTETLLRMLQEDYEANLDKKEKALEDAEKQRLRKLMLEGTITVSMMEHPDGKHKRSKKRKHKRKDNAHTKKKVGHPSIMHDDSPYYQHVAERSELSPHSMDKIQCVVSQMELIENKDAEESQKENEGDRTNGDEEVSTGSSHGNSPRERSMKKQVQWSKPKRQVNSGDRTVAKSTPRNYPKGKFSKKESPLLHEFREEETVDGLYRLAERLVL